MTDDSALSPALHLNNSAIGLSAGGWFIGYTRYKDLNRDAGQEARLKQRWQRAARSTHLIYVI